MKLTRESPLPDGGEWIGTREAAEIWSRGTGHDITQSTLRRWCKTHAQVMEGMEVFHLGDRYFIEKDTFLRVLEERALRLLGVIEEERKKGPAVTGK